MATVAEPAAATAAPPARSYSVFAGLLSYLVPGLGQIYQGRFAKGLLFLVALHGMFFYGMYLGDWSNVYLPTPEPGRRPGGILRNQLPAKLQWLSIIINDRLAFAGQFWIGVSAWPAIMQYNQVPLPYADKSAFWRNFQRTPPEDSSKLVNDRALQEKEQRFAGWDGKTLNQLQADGDKRWDLGLIYTVIAGVLNILVIYDAFAGPAFTGSGSPEEKPAPDREAVPT